MKQTANIKNISTALNFFLKPPKSIIEFFISIIGPKIKNPITEPFVKLLIKVLAIKASVSEQTDNIKAINNINIIEETFPPPIDIK